MTNEDVMVKILSETLGRDEQIYRQILQVVKPLGDHRLAEELTDAAAEELLAALRMEKPGILNWVVAGWKQTRAVRW